MDIRLLPRPLAILALLALALLAPRARSAWLPSDPASAGGPAISFQRGALDFTIDAPTSLAFGPDGRLYVASQEEIWALTLDPQTQEVLATQRIAFGLTAVLGLAFDPTAPASPVTVYASRQDTTAPEGYWGTISKFTAPSWQRQDIITHLPTSEPLLNHMTNGLAFDAQGRLFIAQGSDSDAGIADPPGNQLYYHETPLSAAILIADIHAPGFDGHVTYSPATAPADDAVDQTGGDVHVFAPGLRNPYDLVWHSNGMLYATDNGPLGKATSLACAGDGAGATSTADELNLIEQGNYYGFPNRNRGRTDPRQCTYHAPDEGNGPDYTAPIAILPSHCSCDGLAEYTSSAFQGAMRGNLINAEFQRGSVTRIVLSADGRSVVSRTALASQLGQPLDVAVGNNGTIFVAEYSANRISFLQPDSDGDGCSDPRELGPDPAEGGRRDPNNPWDFYDLNGDRTISLAGDILPVAAAFGTSTGANYSAAKDRSPQPGGDPWDLGAPDGVINVLDDIMGAASQFGHRCILSAAPP